MEQTLERKNVSGKIMPFVALVLGIIFAIGMMLSKSIMSFYLTAPFVMSIFVVLGSIEIILGALSIAGYKNNGSNKLTLIVSIIDIIIPIVCIIVFIATFASRPAEARFMATLLNVIA